MKRYRLLKEHTFNKDVKPVGDTVLLPPQTGDWLVEQGVLELVQFAEPEPPKIFATKPRRRVVQAQPGRSCCGWSQ